MIVIIGMVLLYSCNEDESILKPTIETVSATVIDDGGVRLFGEIHNLNVASVHGFVLSDYEGGTLNMNYNKVETEFSEVNGEYSIDFRNGLVAGKMYYFNAFIEYKEDYIFGEEMSFLSNGSASPIIVKVTPSIAYVGDTITITGKHFSEKFKVLFNDIEVESLIKTDTLTKAIVPYDYYRDQPYNNLSIKKSTQETTLFDEFSMYTPEVISVEPYYAHEKDTITIIGKHFNLVNGQNKLSMDAYGNYINLEIIESSRTKIKFVPGSFYDLSPSMRLVSQFQTIDFNDKFRVKLPIITGAPDCLKYGETTTIYGENFPNVSSSFNSQFSLTIGGVQFSTAGISKDSIVLNITDRFFKNFILNDIVIEYLGETITYEKEICIDEPWIKLNFTNPQHKPHNYQNETYGIVNYNVGKFNTETYHFDSVINEQLPESIRYGNLRVWHEDKIYHYDESTSINKFYSYNFLNGNLVELTPFPGSQRINGLMACVGDYIYLGLGINNAYQPFDDIWRYSITNDRWEFILTYPGINTSEDAVTDPLIFEFDNRLFFGGTNPSVESNVFWEIDLNSYSLLPKSNIPLVWSDGLKGVTLNSKGFFENIFLYEYDLLNDQWIIHEDIVGIGFVYTSSPQSLFISNGNIYRSVTTSAPYYSLLFKMNMNYLED